jgi:hypothetical protein
MPTISVICASPPGINAGMTTVDLAFHGLLRKHQLDAHARFFRMLPPPEEHAASFDLVAWERTLPYLYEDCLGNLDAIRDSDLIVYWGDFLHERYYQDYVAKQLAERGLAADRSDAAGLVREHLFLAGAPDNVLRNTIVFGGTLIFNRARDLRDEEYRRQYTRFFKGVGAAWLRDVYSAAAVAELRGDGDSHLGVDGALLLDDAGLRAVPRSADAATRTAAAPVGVYFARTRERQELLTRFARDLCRRLGAEGRWLPWGDRAAFSCLDVPRMRKAFPKMIVGRGPEGMTVSDVVAAVGDCRLIVTDTYHLCVNAWRLGVPAICIANATPDVAWNWNSGHAYCWRDKRHTFYATHDALEYFVHASEVDHRRSRRRRLDQIVDLLADTDLGRHIASSIAGCSAAVEAQLVEAMRRRLGGMDAGLSARERSGSAPRHAPGFQPGQVGARR